LSDEWVTYVDPEDYFDPFNVSLHGIDEFVVKGAPNFPELTDTLYSYIEGTVLVCIRTLIGSPFAGRLSGMVFASQKVSGLIRRGWHVAPGTSAHGGGMGYTTYAR